MNKTIEETIEIIDKMLTIPKAQMYWAAQRDKERQDELDKTKELFVNDIVDDIIKINDSYFIVEHRWLSRENHPNWFSIVANGYQIHGDFDSLDMALLGVANHMQNGNTDAVYWAAKLMTKDKEEP